MRVLGLTGFDKAPRRPLARRAGGSVIVLLICVVVIALVMLWGPFARDPQTEVTQAQTNLDRSADAACMLNRQAIATDLTALRIANPGQPLDMSIVRRKINIPACPRGGEYMIGPDGQIYCTKHFPPPVEQLTHMVSLAPAPTPTPALGATSPLGPVPAMPLPAATPTPPAP